MAVGYKEMDRETAQKFQEAETLRRVAFLGVSFSTVAMLVCVVALPMTYNYIQFIHIILQNEMDFCEVRHVLGAFVWTTMSSSAILSSDGRSGG